MGRERTVLLVCIALVVAALACSGPPPTRRPTLEATVEDAPTLALLPTPTPTEGAKAEAATPEDVISPTAEPKPEEVLRVAYANGDGRLWIAEVGAGARPLTSGPGDSGPVISPDGRWVVYRHEVPAGPSGLPRYELRVIGSDGTGDRVLLPVERLPSEMGVPFESEVEVLLDRLPLQVRWFPDGSALAFNTHIEYGYGLAANEDLWRVELSSGELTQLLIDGSGGVFAIAPDGRAIAAASAGAVVLARADGNDARTVLTFEFVNTASEYAYMPLPVWTADSSLALVTISSPEPFGPDARGTIWRLPLHGEARAASTLDGNLLFASMGDRMWSADRARVAYSASPEGGGPADLVIADVDGGEAAVYATGDIEFLGWAPAGSRFAYARDGWATVLVGAPGADPLPLATFSGGARPAAFEWAGADRVVYAVIEEGNFAIHVQRVGGEGVRVASGSGIYPDLAVSW